MIYLTAPENNTTSRMVTSPPACCLKDYGLCLARFSRLEGWVDQNTHCNNSSELVLPWGRHSRQWRVLQGVSGGKGDRGDP